MTSRGAHPCPSPCLSALTVSPLLWQAPRSASPSLPMPSPSMRTAATMGCPRSRPAARTPRVPPSRQWAPRPRSQPPPHRQRSGSGTGTTRVRGVRDARCPRRWVRCPRVGAMGAVPGGRCHRCTQLWRPLLATGHTAVCGEGGVGPGGERDWGSWSGLRWNETNWRAWGVGDPEGLGSARVALCGLGEYGDREAGRGLRGEGGIGRTWRLE